MLIIIASLQVDTEISPNDVIRAYNIAAASMMQLNQTGARLMREYDAHACTDVTGFGIIGHARNLAREQKASVDIEIDKLLVIAGMAEIDAYVSGGSRFKV